jgi:hypothetical protein
VTELSDFRKEVKSDIKDLHEKANGIALDVADISGQLKRALPNEPIATRADIDRITDSKITQHHIACQKKTPKSIQPPMYSPYDKKTIAGLTGVIIALSVLVGKLVDKFVEIWP